MLSCSALCKEGELLTGINLSVLYILLGSMLKRKHLTEGCGAMLAGDIARGQSKAAELTQPLITSPIGPFAYPQTDSRTLM